MKIQTRKRQEGHARAAIAGFSLVVLLLATSAASEEQRPTMVDSPGAVVGSVDANAPAEQTWQRVALQDGVLVEEQSVPGRGLPKFRGTLEIAASPEQIVSILSDVDSHIDWMPNCAESRVLEAEPEAGSQLVYRRTAAPWPVSDREVVIRSRVEVIDPGRTIRVRFESVDVKGVPVASGAVRMPRVEGFYLLQALDARRTRVIYQVDADPGGSLPGWLASRTSRDNPIQTLVGLRTQTRLRTQPTAIVGD